MLTALPLYYDILMGAGRARILISYFPAAKRSAC